MPVWVMTLAKQPPQPMTMRMLPTLLALVSIYRMMPFLAGPATRYFAQGHGGEQHRHEEGDVFIADELEDGVEDAPLRNEHRHDGAQHDEDDREKDQREADAADGLVSSALIRSLLASRNS